MVRRYLDPETEADICDAILVVFKDRLRCRWRLMVEGLINVELDDQDLVTIKLKRDVETTTHCSGGNTGGATYMESGGDVLKAEDCDNESCAIDIEADFVLPCTSTTTPNIERVTTHRDQDTTTGPPLSEYPQDVITRPHLLESPQDVITRPHLLESPQDVVTRPRRLESPQDVITRPHRLESPQDDVTRPHLLESPQDDVTRPHLLESPQDVITTPHRLESPQDVITRPHRLESPQDVITKPHLLESPQDVVTRPHLLESPQDDVTRPHLSDLSMGPHVSPQDLTMGSNYPESPQDLTTRPRLPGFSPNLTTRPHISVFPQHLTIAASQLPAGFKMRPHIGESSPNLSLRTHISELPQDLTIRSSESPRDGGGLESDSGIEIKDVRSLAAPHSLQATDNEICTSTSSRQPKELEKITNPRSKSKDVTSNRSNALKNQTSEESTLRRSSETVSAPIRDITRKKPAAMKTKGTQVEIDDQGIEIIRRDPFKYNHLINKPRKQSDSDVARKGSCHDCENITNRKVSEICEIHKNTSVEGSAVCNSPEGYKHHWKKHEALHHDRQLTRTPSPMQEMTIREEVDVVSEGVQTDQEYFSNIEKNKFDLKGEEMRCKVTKSDGINKEGTAFNQRGSSPISEPGSSENDSSERLSHRELWQMIDNCPEISGRYLSAEPSVTRENSSKITSGTFEIVQITAPDGSLDDSNKKVCAIEEENKNDIPDEEPDSISHDELKEKEDMCQKIVRVGPQKSCHTSVKRKCCIVLEKCTFESRDKDVDFQNSITGWNGVKLRSCSVIMHRIDDQLQVRADGSIVMPIDETDSDDETESIDRSINEEKPNEDDAIAKNLHEVAQVTSIENRFSKDVTIGKGEEDEKDIVSVESHKDSLEDSETNKEDIESLETDEEDIESLETDKGDIESLETDKEDIDSVDSDNDEWLPSRSAPSTTEIRTKILTEVNTKDISFRKGTLERQNSYIKRKTPMYFNQTNIQPEDKETMEPETNSCNSKIVVAKRKSREPTRKKSSNIHHDQNSSSITAFTDKNNLEKTMANNRKFDINIEICDICNKVCRNKSFLKTHMRLHAGNSKEYFRFTCHFCSKRFSVKAALDKHMKIAHRTGNLPKALPRKHKQDKPVPDQLNFPPTKDVPISPETQIKIKESLYKCGVCGKHFYREILLNVHMLVHSRDPPFPCPECGKKFAKMSHLMIHMKTHTGEKPYTCCVCEMKFICKTNRDNHVRCHTGDRPFSCKVCKKTFISRSHCTRHEKIHKTTYQCKVCKREFYAYADLLQHKKSHTVYTEYRCLYCNKVFPRKFSLRTHMWIHTGVKLYKCEKCQKRFAQNAGLVKHMRLHTGEKPYKCDRCPEVFHTHCKLALHKLKHTGVRPYKCNVCPKTFFTKCSFKRHSKIHSGEKPYKCSLCGKGFVTDGARAKHVKCHDDVKNEKCNLCGNLYKSKDSLRRHRRLQHKGNKEGTHTGEKPYNCEICEMVFSAVGKLNQHKKKVHGEVELFPCRFCDKVYLKRQSYLNHCRFYHNVDAKSGSYKNVTDNGAIKCSACDKTFSCAKYAKNHEQTVHFFERKYKCTRCEFVFKAQSHLNRHMVTTHATDRKYTCSYCGKSYKTKSVLQTHEKSHQSEKGYKCKTCSRAFKTYSLMWSHAQKHSNKLFCETCGKKFSTRQTLKVHELSHTGKRPHRCGTCAKVFTHQSLLKKHEDTHVKRDFTCEECGKVMHTVRSFRKHKLLHASDKPFRCDICGIGCNYESQLKRHKTMTHNKNVKESSTNVKPSRSNAKK